MAQNRGPLVGIRVLDMSRILAGPSAAQLLADLGAEVIKVERPGAGDDTRKWGPPYLKGPDGEDTTESAYYLAANRGKRSITIDIAVPQGQKLLRRLLAKSDVLIENYKFGGLSKYTLGYEDLKADFPGLIYCSITGFGHTGPLAKRAGYDFLAQGQSGLMSVTGDPDGAPMKMGVAVTDVLSGLYASNAILAALHHRHETGRGQHIDCALLDCAVAAMVNVASAYLVSEERPPRQGNAHPSIVPYTVMPSSDGHFILAVGNDTQFQKWCDFAGATDLAAEGRFATNPGRVTHRDALIPAMTAYTVKRSKQEWIEGLSAIGVPCGPIQSMDEVFSDEQVIARGMRVDLPHPLAADGTVPLVASPLNFSETPVRYEHAPPYLGQHTREVLEEILECDETEIDALLASGATG